MRNKFDIKEYILTLYILVVILLQIELTVLNTAIAVFPVLIVIFSIYTNNKKIGILGLFLFYTLSLSTIKITNIENYSLILLEIILLIIPSILLISQILQIENKKIFILPFNKKPMIISTILIITIFLVFYSIATLSLEGYILSADSISGQIVLLAGLTTITCGPFLIFTKKNIN